MNEKGKILKPVAKAAISALVLLLVGSVYYYKERMLFSDASYIAFRIINDSSLYIQELRYGSFITQIVPLVCSKLHLSLHTVILAYSISFNLFFLIIAVCLVWWFRQYGFAVIMCLYYFLFVSETYFWTNNEIHQAVAWMFFWLGSTIYMGKNGANQTLGITLFTLLGALTVATHFLVVIPCLFLWIYLILEKKDWPFNRRQTIIYSAILATLIFTKLMISLSLPYDGPHLHDPTHVSLHDILNTFGNVVIVSFLKRCLTNYWLAVLVFVAGMATLMITKEKKLFYWTLLSTVGYMVAIKLAFGGYGDMLLFYIESEWASMGIIIGAAFVFHFLPRLKPALAVGAFLLIILVRSLYILSAAPIFEKRTRIKERVFAKMEEKNITKLVLNDSILRKNYLGEWSMAEESLMLSVLNKDYRQRTFTFANDFTLSLVGSAGNTFMIESYCAKPINKLNNTYFSIDTIETYKVLTREELFK